MRLFVCVCPVVICSRDDRKTNDGKKKRRRGKQRVKGRTFFLFARKKREREREREVASYRNEN